MDKVKSYVLVEQGTQWIEELLKTSKDLFSKNDVLVMKKLSGEYVYFVSTSLVESYNTTLLSY